MAAVSVIGSGIGGLAAAIRLAIKGHSVDVFEKNAGPGGKLGLMEREGYLFDTGPSLFTQPENLEALFLLAGKDINQYFTYRPVEVACRYFFENGRVINAYTDPGKFAQELDSVAGEDPDAVRKYLDQSGRVYRTVGSIFLNYSLHKASTWLHRRILPALFTVGYDHLFRNLDAFNRKRFRSPETVQLFNRFATYNGSDPYQAPGMLSLIPHLEQNQGTYYPEGGMYRIVEALYQLAKDLGVRFHFSQAVSSIVVHNRKVAGLIVEEKMHPADFVVSNVDVYYTYLRLLNDPRRADRVLKRERSSSALIFYWGIGESFPMLQLHNIFFARNYAKEFEHLFRLKTCYEDPTVYIDITAKMESGQAPDGKENWFVMVNAPARPDAFSNATIQELRAAVLSKLSRMLGRDIGALIETESILTPKGIQDNTDAFLGSLYGTSSNSRFAAFLRHPNHAAHIDGLYFTGGSVHPGGGIPLCMKSAAIVAGMIPDAG
jgi:phytoene desaturase